MKIALVLDGLGYGGIERVGLDYIKLLIAVGHQVDVINVNPKYEDMLPQLPESVHYFRKRFSIKLCPDLYSYGVKSCWWGKFAYPIMHVLTSLTIPFRKIVRKPHEKYDLAIAFAGHFRDLTLVGKNFIRAEKKMCWLHGSLAEYLLSASGYGDLYKKIKNLVVLSEESQYAALAGNKFLKDLNIHKIYNPTYILEKAVDASIVQQLNEQYGEFILSIGRFEKQKDQKTIIKAVQILKKQGLSTKFLFVGDGSMLEENKLLAKELGVEELCIFVGSRADVENFYSACSFFVHSSPAEGLPTVLLEAMSFGKPVIATNSPPGVKEILQDGEFGVVVPIANEVELAEKIKLFIFDKNEYQKYSVKALKRSYDFSPTIVKEKILSMIQEL